MGWSCTWTSAALIVLAGKPLPVRLTTVTEGSAALGVAEVVKVTTEDPCANSKVGTGEMSNAKRLLVILANRFRRDSEPIDIEYPSRSKIYFENTRKQHEARDSHPEHCGPVFIDG
jgi:hypothetical protein